jgi:glutamine synthetase
METGDGLAEQDATISVPDSLGAALDALEADTALVQALGAELVANHVFIKRDEIGKTADRTPEGVRDYYIRHI